MYVLNDRTKYENAIYTNEVERTLLTYINNTLINGSYIKSLSYNAEIFDNSKISLGSALVDEIKVSINKEGISNLNDINEFYFEEKITYGDGTEDTIPIGYFYSLPNNVDTSSKDFVKFTLKSKMELLKEPFKVSELISDETTLTRKGLVEAICNKYDLYLASEDFINNDIVIGNYDDSIYATSYLTMISERAGGFAYIGRTKTDGKLPLYIKSLNETDKVTIPNQTLGEYENKDKVTISKISYTNGVDLIEQGDDTGITIYLSNNSIFTCTEEEVLNIYNSLNGLSFQSLVVKIWGDSTIDKGDLITIDDLTTFAQMSWEYQRGFIGSYRTKLEKSASSMEVSKISASEERRIIRTEINELDGSLKIISEKVDKINSDVTTSKSVEGNPIRIEDAGAYDIDRLYLEGNSYQETTQQGRNICPTDINDWVLGQWTTDGGTSIYQNRIRVKRLIPCKPNTTYYVQTFLESRAFALRTFKEDGTFNKSIGAVYRGATFTTDENSYYLAITIYSELGGTEDLLALIESGELKPYITLNSETNRNFEEYIPDSPSPNYPQEIEVVESIDVKVTNGLESTDSNYQEEIVTIDLQDEFVGKCTTLDTLDVVTGKLNKNVGRVQLNGLESITIETNTEYTRFRTKIQNAPSDTRRFSIKSSHFKNMAGGGHDVGGAFIYQSTLFMYLPTDVTNVEQAKVWLANNKPIFYYDLAEPYEVQLDTNSIRLFEGINNILIDANLEPSYVSLTYLVDNVWNSQYATKSQLEVTQTNINSVVQDTTSLNANLTDLQALVSVENTNLKNALGDLTTDLEENYATNDSVLSVTNSVSNIQTSLNQQIKITQDIELNGVKKVTTETGFTFDENGLTITETNANTKTTIDEDGMTIYSTTGSSNTEMLIVDSQGVQAENVSVRTYLMVGKNSRFQDYETGTGCFYVGE